MERFTQEEETAFVRFVRGDTACPEDYHLMKTALFRLTTIEVTLNGSEKLVVVDVEEKTRIWRILHDTSTIEKVGERLAELLRIKPELFIMDFSPLLPVEIWSKILENCLPLPLQMADVPGNVGMAYRNLETRNEPHRSFANIILKSIESQKDFAPTGSNPLWVNWIVGRSELVGTLKNEVPLQFLNQRGCWRMAVPLRFATSNKSRTSIASLEIAYPSYEQIDLGIEKVFVLNVWDDGMRFLAWLLTAPSAWVSVRIHPRQEGLKLFFETFEQFSWIKTNIITFPLYCAGHFKEFRGLDDFVALCRLGTETVRGRFLRFLIHYLTRQRTL